LLVASTLYKLKVIPSDTGLELLKHLDYTFLAKATKQTPQQLGQS
jgi:hypothetical protein